jgi:hypothetical protein
MKVKLKKALRHKGKDLLELDIPLENLVGMDLIDVEQQLARSGKIMMIAEFSKGYLIRIAARAAKIPVEVLESLSAQDFTTVTNQVQNFLMGSDSGTGETESESPTQEPVPETFSEE